MTRWLRPWLGCVALLYPAYWIATVLVWVLAPVLRSVLGGPAILQYMISPFGAIASIAPDASGMWIQWLLALLLCIGLLWIPRMPAFVGSVVVMAGVVSLGTLFRNGRAARMPEILGYVLIACGLRKILRSAPESRYLGRSGFLIAAIAVPLALFPLMLRGPRVLPLRMYGPAIAAAILSFIVSLRWTAMPRPMGWQTAAAGIAATVLLASGSARVGSANEQRQRDASTRSVRAAMAQLPAVAADAPYPKQFFQRGVSLTAEYPAGYASEMARETLRMMPQYGVNAVALVPYGNISSPNRFGGGWESDEGIELLSRAAHATNIKVMLKPQLWGRTWPAEFEPANAADRKSWYEHYAMLVDHYSKLAARIHADLFCIGTELAKMSRDEAEWRKLIAIARKNYRGPITYAATQGPEFETLQFWDALDYIGLSNYYPLPDTLDAAHIVGKVETVQKKFNKPVIFAEAGFSSYEAPHKAPWDETPRKLAMQDQAHCYEALFRAFYRKPWFHGFYWWKVGTNRFGGPSDGSHTPWGKPAMDVMKRWYTTGGR